MTTHINETCTFVSNLKKVQKMQDELHSVYTDTDMLRKFNENFDEHIIGKVISCDIEIYDSSQNQFDLVIMEIELMIYNTDNFYVVNYITDFDNYFKPRITVYARQIHNLFTNN